MPLSFDIRTGNATTPAISLGALGDSYYEYLLKVGHHRLALCIAASNSSILAAV